MWVVVLLLMGASSFANDNCKILPIDSYNANFEIFSDLLYSGEKNLTEIAEVLSLKQQSEYETMFLRMKDLAVKSNHPYAYYNLGQFYRLGIGTPININYAVENYFEAAIRGSEKGIVNLALILDQAVRDGVTAYPTHLVPIDKAYGFYWLLTAITTVEDKGIKKSLETLLQKRLQDSEYKEILSTNYPHFNSENPYKALLGATIIFSSNFSTTFTKKAPVDILVGRLNKLTCLLETNLHFLRFNKTGYLKLNRESLNQSVSNTLVVLKKLRSYTTKDKEEYKIYLNSLEKWNQELTSFLETTNTL